MKERSMVPTGNDYLATEVMTAAPQKLQLMLIEGALRVAGQARQFLADQQREAASRALIRSQSILAELLSGLDHRTADESVRRVAGVYLFIYRSLIAANLEQSEARLGDALRVLEIERDTWRMVCERLGSEDSHEFAGGGASFEA
jgi:flagellar secretion chaperone FliS